MKMSLGICQFFGKEVELFKCPCCLESYDLSERVPMQLAVCCHSICSSCLKQILSVEPPTCPLDCSPLPFSDLRSFKENIVIKQVLELRMEKALYKKGFLENRFLNLEENVKSRSDSHLNSGNSAQAMQKAQEKMDKKRKRIKIFLEDIKDWYKNIFEGIEENQRLQVNAIHQNFEKIRNVIDEREREMLFETKLYYDNLKNRLNDLLGDNSQLYKSFLNKDFELKDTKNPKELLSLNQRLKGFKEDINKWRNKVDVDKITQTISSELGKMINSFSFQGPKDFPECIGFSLVWPLESLDKVIFGETCEVFMNDTANVLDRLIIKSHLNIEIDREFLSIKPSEQHRGILNDPERWEKVTQMKLNLTQKVSEDDENFLGYIWRKTKNLSILTLKLATGSVSNELCRALTADKPNISLVNIEIQNYDIAANNEVLLLIKQILSRTKNLEEIYIKMNKANFPSKIPVEMFRSAGFAHDKIKILYLNFDGANIQNTILDNFLVPMPSLQVFELVLSDTNTTNKAIDLLSDKVLSKSKFLKKLNLTFNRNTIGDNEMKTLSNYFMNLSNIELNLYSDHITDKTAETLSQRLPFNNLVHLKLSFFNTRITDQGFRRIFRPMPNIRTYMLIAPYSFISNGAVEALIQNVLIPNNVLESLVINLCNTAVSDQSIFELSENIKSIQRVSNLELSLASPQITEESIRPLLESISSDMKSLKKLILRIDDKNSSAKLKSEVTALLDKINNKYYC